MAYTPFTLSPQRQQQLEALAADLKLIRADIARAKKAGIDPTAWEEQLAKAEATRRGLLQQFSPQSE